MLGQLFVPISNEISIFSIIGKMAICNANIQMGENGPRLEGFDLHNFWSVGPLLRQAFLWCTDKDSIKFSPKPFVIFQRRESDKNDEPMPDVKEFTHHTTISEALFESNKKLKEAFHDKFSRDLNGNEKGAVLGALQMGQKDELTSICGFMLDLIKGLLNSNVYVKISISDL